MPRDEIKPDILHVKRIPPDQLPFHYSREERLKMRFGNEKEASNRKKILKAGRLLVILLAAAIIILLGMLVYKYFFQ